MTGGPAALVFPCDEIWAALSAALPSGSVEGWSKEQTAYWESLISPRAPASPTTPAAPKADGEKHWIRNLVILPITLAVAVAVACGLCWKRGIRSCTGMPLLTDGILRLLHGKVRRLAYGFPLLCLFCSG